MRHSPATTSSRFGVALALAGGLAVLVPQTGCMSLTPQLRPTDYAELEQVEDREERERLYAENQIYRHREPQGMRYTKGASLTAHKRSWQSLDAILRSDANTSAALPRRQQRLSRLFTALTIVAGVVTVAGAAASSREGLNLGELNGTGGLMLGGGLATLGFGIAAGVFYGKTKKGYEEAVDLYNDSLGMRLGILDADGKYIAPKGTLIDKDGNIVLDPTADDAPKAKPDADVAAPEAPADEPASVEPVAESDPAADAATPEGEPAEASPEGDPASSEAAPADEATAPEGGEEPQPDADAAKAEDAPEGSGGGGSVGLHPRGVAP